MKKRNSYFDFLRGIAILMVIGIHTYSINNFDSIIGTANIVVRQVLNCAVPLFLAISGFFLGKKDINTKEHLFSFWRKQIPKVYIPCLIWSLPLFFLALIHGRPLFLEVLKLLACGYSIYYFIALIIQYYFLFPVLNKFNNKFGILISGTISILSIITLTYFMVIKGKDIPLLLYAGPFPVWIVFFVTGLYLSNHSREYSLRLPFFLVIIGLLLECMETYFSMGFNGSGVGIKLSSFIFSWAAIILLFSEKLETAYRENIIKRVIRYIGQISFGIYLTHCFFIMIISHFHIDMWGFRWLFVAVLTSISISGCKYLFPYISEKFLGFK